MESPFTASGNIDYCTRFYQEVVECLWKRCWIVAILQYIHRHVCDLEPPVQPMYSEEALLHGRHVNESIKTGLRQLSSREYLSIVASLTTGLSFGDPVLATLRH